jgi:hypothetical protein
MVWMLKIGEWKFSTNLYFLFMLDLRCKLRLNTQLIYEIQTLSNLLLQQSETCHKSGSGLCARLS